MLDFEVWVHYNRTIIDNINDSMTGPSTPCPTCLEMNPFGWKDSHDDRTNDFLENEWRKKDGILDGFLFE
ncbi:hypothetical protein J45TS6_34790 [Paenibacillus sp. J45TS6]|nr:hypothetical protein J45TS6_34790 [Paenibacillus sp. J45TS6]